MKPTFFLVAFTLLCFEASGQSLTFRELTDSLRRIDNSPFLLPKRFVLIQATGAEYLFIKNKGAANEETIHTDKGGFAYISNNVNYITTMLKQAKSKLRKIRTIRQVDQRNNGSSGTRYEFTDGKIAIAFVIFRNYGIVGFDFNHTDWH